MRSRALLAGVTTLLALTACTPQPGPPPTPPPPPTASPSVTPALPGGPEAVLAALTTAVRPWGDVPSPELLAEQDLGSVQVAPCRMLAAEARPGESFTPPDPTFAGLVEVNPVASFGGITVPTTVMEVTVTGFASAAVAERTAERARSTRCPADFTLSYRSATGRRASTVVRVGAVPARLTTGTVSGSRSAPGSDYLPGEALLVLAHGPLLLTVGVLKFGPGTDAPEVTALARRTALEVASAVLAALPPNGTPPPPAPTASPS
ncbi:hypothetical protein O7626_25750 [Micromonospora sp. WMMD1102]|uniref:hypothetical protein n=1 Tax=Micromonospora sp. WMMD1102 TaxID=3016105 RepID=UPI002414F506|nr:hypothetical protein [Micromonospora sp. WMMD1102]MDG4789293.1 hypothetical protein [Micromonospora sp. WMMD1102]